MWVLVALVLTGLGLTVPVTAHAASSGKLVLVLDSSGSMKERVGGDRKIDIAKSALNSVVAKLPAQAEVGLRVYGATIFSRSRPGACTDSQLVVPIGTDNRAALRAQIATYKPYGETPISYSLKQAARDVGPTGQRTIVLVSDGEETCDVDPCVTAASIAKSGIHLKIDVIGLRVTAKARSQLQCVADKGHGTYYDADDQQSIEDSLDKLATRAFRPFQLTGTPIEGSEKKKTAPVAAPGQYLDNLPGDDGKIYYRIPRTVVGSTLHASITTIASRNGTVPTIYVHLVDSTGTECGSGLGQAIALVGSLPVITAAADSWHYGNRDRCRSDKGLLLDVSGSNDAFGKKFELVVTEEPPVVSLRHLPAPEATPAWRPMKEAKQPARPPVAGNSLGNAPVLEPGSYRSTILTGENQVFAVQADWGQRIQVQAVVAPRHGALARELGVTNSLDLHLFGALRGPYRSYPLTGQPDSDTSLVNDDEAYRVYGATPTVRFLNRNSYTVQPAATPGPQYVVLNLANDVDHQFLVPYTLTIKRFGRAGDGKPTYLAPATPSPSPTPTPPPPTTTTTPPPSNSQQGVPVSTVVGLTAAALVVGAAGVLGGLLLHRRRRSTAPQQPRS